ncbi:hypothetical protein Tco_0861091 [Tanacetum coccineum]|uniref:Uncharacterized protein n=1 Tax=Tanacetum coccineum TaxID=301880 RepID=A0ABQ5BMH0_9ASTR
MPPKRTSTSETPAITLAAIQQLINNGISSALKAQVASMASASNQHHEGQIEDILNYLDELYLHHIEKMEEGRIDRMIIRRNSNELKIELKKIHTQIIKLQKKQLGQKDKIAFAHYRISNLERIILPTQNHQTLKLVIALS